jgi:hypothetical protein
MSAKPLGKNDMQNFVSGSVLAPAADVIAFQKNIIPKLTTTQRDALSGASLYEGLLIHNLTTHKLNVRGASAWEAVTSV